MKLSEHSPHLQLEWSDRNDKEFENISHGSHYLAWWRHSCGHEWQATVNNRTKPRATGCPVCRKEERNIKLSAFKNNNPIPEHLRGEFSPKNERSFDSYSAHSQQKVWWICKNGHETQAVVSSRTKGHQCFQCTGKTVCTGKNSLIDLASQVVISEYSQKNASDASNIAAFSNNKVWWVCENGHEWQAEPYSRMAGNGCPKCYSAVSKGEQELFDYISTFVSAIQHDRTIIAPKEVDIYVPAHDIAIEFNGLYWHREDVVGQKYHFNKWKECADQGIQLVTIWEDDWSYRRPVVEKMLKEKIMGRNAVGARETVLTNLSYSMAKDFLDENHIQGSARASMYMGLKLDGEVVAVGAFRKYNSSTYLDRYASTLTVIGGLDKMMRQIGGHFTTFADLSVSSGDLYEKTGWVRDKLLPPDYQYIVGGRRVHKFNYRLNRFKTDRGLTYEKDRTEKELARMNNIYRIYNCGKIRYTKEV